MKEVLYKVAYSGDPTRDDFDDLMKAILAGTAKEIHLAGLFGMLHDRPVNGPMISDFAKALDRYTVHIPTKAIGLAGTGGSGYNTLNISTAAALVVAAAGIPVAKHGGRSNSGAGSADVLEALGANIEMTPDQAVKARAETNFTFLFAPIYNPVLEAVQKFRKAYGAPTLFNWAAPLVNPAELYGNLIGLPECRAQNEYSFATMQKGTRTSVLVSGTDGLDEATITSNTHVTIERKQQATERFIIRHGDVQMESAQITAIKGGTAQYNAKALRHLLNKAERGPYRDIVLLNAGLALKASGRMREHTVLECVDKVTPYLDKGNAEKVLDEFISLSRD